MTRPLRIEFPGAVYHVTSRGDRQEPIFRDDTDRQRLLDVVDRAMARLNAQAFAFCLMGNHYHFVIRTRQANLSRLMRQINGEYTRAFNRRHQVTGHLFQGRFHAVLVDSDAYLIEACRYVELNPVRACLVDRADEWAWCSYRAHVGLEHGPVWLATADLHGHLLGHDISTDADRRCAESLYSASVGCGIGVALWSEHLRGQIYLGSADFMSEMKARAAAQRLACTEIAKVQRVFPSNLAEWLAPDRTREEAFRQAYSIGGLTMGEIARQAAMSISAVSRMIASAEEARQSGPDTAKLKT